jgi:hypothetical protein
VRPKHRSKLTLQECVDCNLWQEVKRRWGYAKNCGVYSEKTHFLKSWLSINLTQTPGSARIGAVTLTAVVIEKVPHVMTEFGALTFAEAFGEWIPSPVEIEQQALIIRECWTESDFAQRRLKLSRSWHGSGKVE